MLCGEGPKVLEQLLFLGSHTTNYWNYRLLFADEALTTCAVLQCHHDRACSLSLNYPSGGSSSSSHWMWMGESTLSCNPILRPTKTVGSPLGGRGGHRAALAICFFSDLHQRGAWWRCCEGVPKFIRWARSDLTAAPSHAATQQSTTSTEHLCGAMSA
jgi:hypothetical protein